MMMEAFDAYRYYMAIKLHFESDTYDATQYNYKTSAKQQAFWKRKDKYHFAKLGRKFETPDQIINYYVAQFTSEKKWIGDMLSDESAYDSWQKRNQSLSYTFEKDINTLADKTQSFDEIFEAKDTPYPLVVTMYLRGDVCIETVVILNRLTGFVKKTDKTIKDPIVWPEVSKRIRKYTPFVRFDEKKIKEIILRLYTS